MIFIECKNDLLHSKGSVLLDTTQTQGRQQVRILRKNGQDWHEKLFIISVLESSAA